jgi:hypothetical protein
MNAILGLWLAFLFGFGCGLFFAARRNQDLRRELETRCELCIGDQEFGRTIKSAFEMSESEN